MPEYSETIVPVGQGEMEIKKYINTKRGIQKRPQSESASGQFFNPYGNSHGASVEVVSHMSHGDHMDRRLVKSE